MYVRHAPPGRLREDRARPPGVRAVRARAASPGAAGTATEAPASVFLGRARALRPRSTPPRRGSQPHRPSKTSNHTQAHATRRSARSGAARPPAFAPRVRSRGESLARRVARLNCRDARGSAVRSAEARAPHFWRAITSRKPRSIVGSQSGKRASTVDKYLSCSASAVSKKVFLSFVPEVVKNAFRSLSRDDSRRSANIPKRRESAPIGRTSNFERSIFVLAWTGLAGPGPRRFFFH